MGHNLEREPTGFVSPYYSKVFRDSNWTGGIANHGGGADVRMGKEFRQGHGTTYLLWNCTLNYKRVGLYFVSKAGKSKGHKDKQIGR